MYLLCMYSISTDNGEGGEESFGEEQRRKGEWIAVSLVLLQ